VSQHISANQELAVAVHKGEAEYVTVLSYVSWYT